MNGLTHRMVAGLAVSTVLADREAKQGQVTLKPIAGGAIAAALTNLPDLLEPASSPNHRAFFHSLTFAAMVGTGLHKLSQWEARTDQDKLLKALGMLAGAAYLIHLALDFTTRRSLPVFGRL